MPGSLGAMGWTLGDRGMLMTLAREVPELIAGALQGIPAPPVRARAGAIPAEALGRGVFAVHPGGPAHHRPGGGAARAAPGAGGGQPRRAARLRQHVLGHPAAYLGPHRRGRGRPRAAP